MKFHVIPHSFDGRLAIATRPRGGDWLNDDIALVRRLGWGILVSALERSEQFELGLAAESPVAISVGIDFRSFPIPDRSTPQLEALLLFARGLHQELLAGASVAVHCRMGIGRSSLICAATLVVGGAGVEEAWSVIAKARGLEIPDTHEQRDWLFEFARRC